MKRSQGLGSRRPEHSPIIDGRSQPPETRVLRDVLAGEAYDQAAATFEMALRLLLGAVDVSILFAFGIASVMVRSIGGTVHRRDVRADGRYLCAERPTGEHR